MKKIYVIALLFLVNSSFSQKLVKEIGAVIIEKENYGFDNKKIKHKKIYFDKNGNLLEKVS